MMASGGLTKTGMEPERESPMSSMMARVMDCFPMGKLTVMSLPAESLRPCVNVGENDKKINSVKCFKE